MVLGTQSVSISNVANSIGWTTLSAIQQTALPYVPVPAEATTICYRVAGVQSISNGSSIDIDTTYMTAF